MLAAIDIHKSEFQAAVLDFEEGELAEQRFAASREKLREWLDEWGAELEIVAIEATTGWRWVARELQGRGVDVRLVDPGRASALQGRRAQAKTDRLDARWLVTLLANDMLPEAWIPPEDIQRLSDSTRLRKALANDHTRWAQRLHAILVHEGSGASRGQLLTSSGRQRLAHADLEPVARMQVDAMLSVMGTVAAQIDAIDVELRAIAAADERCQALAEIFGVGPILATTIQRPPRGRAARGTRVWRACARPSASPDWRRRGRECAGRARGRGLTCGRRAEPPRRAPSAGTERPAWRADHGAASRPSRGRSDRGRPSGRPGGRAGIGSPRRSRREPQPSAAPTPALAVAS